MDLQDQINSIADRANKLQAQIQTEEATKNALIMPFIQALGYDIFNPLEVIPEYTADIGTKKGEKVDYAIMQEDKPAIIMECKAITEKLDVHKSQLLRYFNVVHARFGILTNGVIYQFFTDLEELNKMDEKPFLEFNIGSVTENIIKEIKKFHKTTFDLDSILSNASDLKYSNEIKAMLSSEFNDPSDDFVRFFAQKTYPGKVTAKILLQFKELVKKTLKNFMSESVNNRLKSAIEKEEETVAGTTESATENSSENEEVQEEEKKNGINTTEEEIEAYFIIKTILRPHMDAERVTHRDTQSYFGILLDDNNRKPICRLWLETNKKYIGVFDQEKNVTRHEITSLNDIYQHTDALVDTLKLYEN